MMEGAREQRVFDDVPEQPYGNGAPAPETMFDNDEPAVRVAKAPETRPRRVAPDVFIPAGLREGQSIDALRAQTLHALAEANDALDRATDPKVRAQEQRHRRNMEERLAAIEARRSPTIAYYDAREEYHDALRAIVDAAPAHMTRAQEHARFWRDQLTLQGKRLAEEQVTHDMRAFDLDAYRRGLEATYAKLAEGEDEYQDDAPELREMEFIKQKLAVFAERMENDVLQRRLHVERQRHTMKRAMERTAHAIKKLEDTRKTLNWYNPFHWSRIVDIDDRLTVMRHEQEDAQQRYRLAAATDVQSEIGIRMPDAPTPRPGRTEMELPQAETRKAA